MRTSSPVGGAIMLFWTKIAGGVGDGGVGV
jgi:hypothetical protein